MDTKVSVAMEKAINSYFKENGIEYNAEYLLLTPRTYDLYVGNSDYNEEDFDVEKEMMRTIVIYYPSEMYAIPKYLTTNELTGIYRRSNRTMKGFMNDLYEEVRI